MTSTEFDLRLQSPEWEEEGPKSWRGEGGGNFVVSVYAAFPVDLAEKMAGTALTKPRLFRRNRLTGSGNPIFESYFEGSAL